MSNEHKHDNEHHTHNHPAPTPAAAPAAKTATSASVPKEFLHIVETPALREKYGTNYQIQYTKDAEGNQGEIVHVPYGPGTGPVGSFNPYNEGDGHASVALGDNPNWYPVYRHANDDGKNTLTGIVYYTVKQLTDEGLLPAA